MHCSANPAPDTARQFTAITYSRATLLIKHESTPFHSCVSLFFTMARFPKKLVYPLVFGGFLATGVAIFMKRHEFVHEGAEERLAESQRKATELREALALKLESKK